MNSERNECKGKNNMRPLHYAALAALLSTFRLGHLQK